MCNCGNKRSQYQQQFQAIQPGMEMEETGTKKVWEDVHFEYTGKTALTVTGGITGKKYRFTHKGDIQLIDQRDAAGMMGVPVLSKVVFQSTG